MSQDKERANIEGYEEIEVERGCGRVKLRIREGECRFECVEDGRRLDPYETLYEVKRGKKVAVSEDEMVVDKWFDVIRQYATCDPKAWIMFAVYHDLRERGRVLKTGPLDNSFTIYERGRPKSLVIVLEETVKFPVEKLFEWLETSKKMSRRCVLAIVDKHGDVSYYVVEDASVLLSSG